VIDHLQSRAAKGARLIYVRGNHDPDPSLIPAHARSRATHVQYHIHHAANGKRYLVLHGDEADGRLIRLHAMTRLGSRIDHALRRLDRFLCTLGRRQPHARGTVGWLIATTNVLAYRHQRLIYDATRAYFLLGRDHLLTQLDVPRGGRVLEVACGTGRNLDKLSQARPDARLYGLDISAQMLRSAQAKLGTRAQLAQGDACDFQAGTLFDMPHFDRIFLSYAVSMIPDWMGAIEQAVAHLAPGGSIHIVDFGRQHRLPRILGTGLNAWLAHFPVTPRHDLRDRLAGICDQQGLTLAHRDLSGSYAQRAILARPF
jgi:S-adenosylmethionine-diacylgycerolhomoserine-N-methlytransferase